MVNDGWSLIMVFSPSNISNTVGRCSDSDCSEVGGCATVALFYVNLRGLHRSPKVHFDFTCESLQEDPEIPIRIPDENRNGQKRVILKSDFDVPNLILTSVETFLLPPRDADFVQDRSLKEFLEESSDGPAYLPDWVADCLRKVAGESWPQVKGSNFSEGPHTFAECLGHAFLIVFRFCSHWRRETEGERQPDKKLCGSYT